MEGSPAPERSVGEIDKGKTAISLAESMIAERSFTKCAYGLSVSARSLDELGS